MDTSDAFGGLRVGAHLGLAHEGWIVLALAPLGGIVGWHGQGIAPMIPVAVIVA